MVDFAKRCRALHPDSADSEQLKWERLAITLHAYTTICALVEIWMSKFPTDTITQKAQWNKVLQREDFMQLIQKDTMLLEKLRPFVNYLHNKDKSDTSDINTLVSGNIRKYYNSLSSVFPIALPENKMLDEVMNHAVRSQRAMETNAPFIEAMWDGFVKEFVNAKIADHDQAWYIEHLANIAYHAADYVLIQKGQPIERCANYLFLKSGFDPAIPQCREFVNKHVDKSSTDSQKVFVWMEEWGVEHLKVLVDGYFIKP